MPFGVSFGRPGSAHLHRSHQLTGEWIRRTADHTTHLLAAKTASSESCRQFLGTAPVICWFTRESAILAGVTDTTPPAADVAAATAANALAGWIGTVPADAAGPAVIDTATAATTPNTQRQRKEWSS